MALTAALVLVLALGSPATSEAQPTAACDYNVLIANGCFLVNGKILAGDQPIAGVFIDSSDSLVGARSGADGSFAIPIVYRGDGAFITAVGFGLAINAGLDDTRKRPVFEFSLPVTPAADLGDLQLPDFQLPEIIQLEVIVETNCGDNVPLGGCELVQTTMTALMLGDIAAISNFQGVYGNESLPFVGRGTLAVFAGTQNDTITFRGEADNAAPLSAKWDGANPFIVRDPNVAGSPLAVPVTTVPIDQGGGLQASAGETTSSVEPTATPIPTAASATAPAAVPPAELAFTGTDRGLAAVGAALLGVGSGVLVVARRRQLRLGRHSQLG